MATQAFPTNIIITRDGEALCAQCYPQDIGAFAKDMPTLLTRLAAVWATEEGIAAERGEPIPSLLRPHQPQDK